MPKPRSRASSLRGEQKIILKEIPAKERKKLSGEQLKELAKLCIKVENHYRGPQDIEWALEKNKFYIVQTRPITTL